MFHHLQPVLNGPEKRHLFDEKEENPRINRFRDKKTGAMVEERKGILHFVQCWPAQGHPDVSNNLPLFYLFLTLFQELGPGGAYGLSSSARLAIENYYLASSPLAKTLSQYFEVLFPESYRKFRKAFEAGVWVQEDPGPWLGRALIYKLQGSLHVDEKDEGPTVSFPCGYFEGGEMIVPDFDVKLRLVQLVFMSF